MPYSPFGSLLRLVRICPVCLKRLPRTSIQSPEECFHLFQIILRMDLPYPSQKEVERETALSPAVKKIKSTIWSTKQLAKNEPVLSLNSKVVFLKLLEKDKVTELSNRLLKHEILTSIELGSKLGRWSFLHFCARWNSLLCMEYLIKDAYLKGPEHLCLLINAKTNEGYTPLMISVIYKSSETLSLILQFGAVDIFLTDNNKTTAYQMAVRSQNQYAIQKLVDYQRANKTSTFLDVKKLQKPFTFPKEEVECCCTTLWHTFTNWVYRSPKNKSLFEAYSEQMHASQKTSEVSTNGDEFRDIQFPPQIRSVCRDPKLIAELNIEWVRVQDLSHTEKGVRLFQTYRPFDIVQQNYIMKHYLTVLQSLARSPILVRKIIAKSEENGCCYKARLYPKGDPESIVVDDFIPCLKGTRQPLFISDNKQSWPFLLQKAWAKTYGSYIECRDVHPRVMLHQMTGYLVETHQLANFEEAVFQNLKRLSGAGFVSVLTSRESPDNQHLMRHQTYSILNFYEKDFKKMFLVGCPFVDPKWKENEKPEPFGLKLIKTHFDTDNQMSIWMDSATLVRNFSEYTVCHVMDSLLRTSFQVKCRQCVFFKFSLTSEQRQRQRYMFKLYQYKQNDKSFYREVIPSEVSVSRDDRINPNLVKTYEHSDRISVIQAFSGEYFCKVSLPTSEFKSLSVVIFGNQKLKVEIIDQQMGKIQWLYLLRDRALKEPMEQCGKDIFKRQVVFFDCLLIIIRDANQVRRTHKISYKDSKVDHCIQGFQESGNVVRLETHDDDFLFAMLKLKTGVSVADLELVYSFN